MAAKHKQKNKHKSSKMRFSAADREEDMDPGDSDHSGDEEDTADRSKKAEEEFNLDEVLKLGGTQSDFVMLAALDEASELVDGGKKGTIDDLEDGELEKFITKLGIRALSTQLQIIPDEEDESQVKEKKKQSQTEPEQNQKAPTDTSQTSVEKLRAPSDMSKPQTSVEKLRAPSDVSKPQTSVLKPCEPKALKKLKPDVFEFSKRSVLLVKPGGKWFGSDYASEVSAAVQDPGLVSRYKALAQRLLDHEVELYRTKKNLQKGANSGWMKTVVTAGVLADRLAAMTVLIQDSPVHSLEHVESLVSMVKKKGSRRMGLMALDTVRELLLSDLLPEQRKLRPFSQRPFEELEERASGNRDARDRRLVLWLFEHLLKNLVAEFVASLETVAHDTVLANKSKALTTAFELLSSRPEQEKALLTQTVNKLGDPEYALAAKASHLLHTLLHRHPNMKSVVCAEVERLLFRANVGNKAQYYAICFLSQVILSREDSELASRLIGIYFSFFGLCVKRRQVQSKMLSALLSGVNRAYPYAAEGDEAVRGHMGALFSVVHSVKFNTAVQALMLLFQVMDSQQSVSDRFYCALYRKLLDPGLSSSSRQSMFLNLVYKSLKADTVLRRVRAFLKRLLQVSAEQSPSFTCGALYLLSEVLKTRPALRSSLDSPQDEEEESFRDAPDEEEAPQRGAAGSTEQHTGGAAAAEGQERLVGRAEEEERPNASWVHHHNINGVGGASYDALHRNPLFCGADHTSLWELHQLAAHFHPSVSLFAKTILQGGSISYSGDPLQDFTLMRFLDRFVFRNPKQPKENSVLKRKKSSDSSALPVNSEEFVSKDESQIPVDQVFFHRYFVRRREQTVGRRPRSDGDNESIEDVDDDEFEKILDSEGDSYYASVKDGDLDFAGGVSHKRGSKDSDSDSDLDSDLDLDDEEVELSLDEEDFGEEFEEEGGAFMDPTNDDDDDDPELSDGDFSDAEDQTDVKPQKNKRKSSAELDFSSASKQNKKKKQKKESNAFTSAEEFGSLLDENSGSKFDEIGLNAMRNSDKAGLKQLKWESNRDDWIHGRDAKTLRRRKTMFQKRKRRGFQTGNRKTGAGGVQKRK